MNSLSVLPFEFVITYIFIIGLCIGSFLNVVILRGLSGESIVFERSKCPKCNNKLKWYMNIPVVSYIFLKGKCAFCSAKISIQYPIVEFVSACFFVLTYVFFGLSIKTLFLWVILSLFIVLSVTDIKETVIIDYHAYLLAFTGLIYNFFGCGDTTIIQSILGAVFGFLFFEILARAGKFFCNHRMFGEGDSLIALGLGSIFGIKVLVLIIVLSILLQGVFALPVLIKKSFDENKKKLAISYILVFASMVYVILQNCFIFIKNQIFYLISITFICILLFWSLRNILFEIKNKKESKDSKYLLMPFGPALIIASSACIFYLPKIKELIYIFLS